MGKDKITGSEYLAKTIKANDISHVFYQELSFVRTLECLDELEITKVLAHSEAAAAYMADGYARTTNKVGVCMSQSIGAANLAAGVHDAWLGNTPVVALTGYKPNSAVYKNGYQESDHKAHFSGVTKYNAVASDAQQMPHLLRQAFREAATGRLGPAHLDLVGFACDVTEAAVMEEDFIDQSKYAAYPVTRPGAEADSIAEAAEVINAAKAPLLVAGRGAVISGCADIIYEISSKCGVPVATTPDGKTIIDEADEMWAGIVGGYGMDCANKAASEADLVIYVGSMVSDQTTLEFNAPPKSTQLIQIDTDASQFGKNYPNTLGLHGDARTVLEQLSSKVNAAKREEWCSKVASYVKDTLQRQHDIAYYESELIPTGRLCKELSDLLPDDAIVVADTGNSAIWANCMLRMKPSQKYIRAAGSLGWSFPASLGAKCGNLDRPVFCFAGDGAIYYHMMEVETAVRYGINTITIINNNSSYSQVVPFSRTERFREQVSFSTVDFAGIAEKMGAVGMRVEKADEISDAIKKALLEDKPVVIEVVTDPVCRGPLPASL